MNDFQFSSGWGTPAGQTGQGSMGQGQSGQTPAGQNPMTQGQTTQTPVDQNQSQGTVSPATQTFGDAPLQTQPVAQPAEINPITPPTPVQPVAPQQPAVSQSAPVMPVQPMQMQAQPAPTMPAPQPPMGMPTMGQQPVAQPAGAQDDSGYTFGQSWTNFATSIKLPPHNLQFDEKHFLELLARSFSLTKDEKWGMIKHVPKLTQDKIEQLIQIFEDEQQKFQELASEHAAYLAKLEANHVLEWKDLEYKFDQQMKKGSDQQAADEIRKNLGL